MLGMCYVYWTTDTIKTQHAAGSGVGGNKRAAEVATRTAGGSETEQQEVARQTL